MPLLGSAAMLLSFDIEAEAMAEHDRWHTHEHLPERLSIPGFRRGTRWVATEGGPRYLVLYEVQDLQTLSSEAYLARLNNPTPWTQRIMPFYRGMRRGLCAVLGSHGFGQGGTAALIRFSAAPAQQAALQRWLLDEALAPLVTLPGLGSVHALQGAQPAAMTNEQRIRGADQGIDSALIVTGYQADAVSACAATLCFELTGRGALDLSCATYAAQYSLSHEEVGA